MVISYYLGNNGERLFLKMLGWGKRLVFYFLGSIGKDGGNIK